MTKTNTTNEAKSTYMQSVDTAISDAKNFADANDGTAFCAIAFMLYSELVTAKKKMAEFAERLAKCPTDAFGWGDDYVDYAARMHVYAGLVSFLTADVSKDESVKRIKEYATREAMRLGANPARSSGQCSNLVERYTAAAYARMFNDFRFSRAMER